MIYEIILLGVYIVLYLYLVLPYYFIYLIAERAKANLVKTILIELLFSCITFVVAFTITLIIEYRHFDLLSCLFAGSLFAMLNFLIPVISTAISFLLMNNKAWHYKWALASAILFIVMGWFLYSIIANGDYVTILT